MLDYLKRKTVRIKSINAEIEIRQLSAKSQTVVVEAYKDVEKRWLAGVETIRLGVPAWAEETVESIAEALSLAQIDEIASAISELSESDLKNSESTQTEPSSSS